MNIHVIPTPTTFGVREILLLWTGYEDHNALSEGAMPLADLTLQDLSACFDMPARDAAKKLGMRLTSLKKLMRKFGISRWYRSHSSVRLCRWCEDDCNHVDTESY